MEQLKDTMKENIKHVKLDIGLSYNAPHSQNWLENEPNLLVIGFEPNPDFLASISSKDNIEKREILLRVARLLRNYCPLQNGVVMDQRLALIS